jgi:hypothetical protein
MDIIFADRKPVLLIIAPVSIVQSNQPLERRTRNRPGHPCTMLIASGRWLPDWPARLKPVLSTSVIRRGTAFFPQIVEF